MSLLIIMNGSSSKLLDYLINHQLTKRQTHLTVLYSRTTHICKCQKPITCFLINSSFLPSTVLHSSAFHLSYSHAEISELYQLLLFALFFTCLYVQYLHSVIHASLHSITLHWLSTCDATAVMTSASVAASMKYNQYADQHGHRCINH